MGFHLPIADPLTCAALPSIHPQKGFMMEALMTDFRMAAEQRVRAAERVLQSAKRLERLERANQLPELPLEYQKTVKSFVKYSDMAHTSADYFARTVEAIEDAIFPALRG